MSKLYKKDENQKTYTSCPWSIKEAILVRVWEVVWNIFVRWLPKICYRWHVILLKLFFINSISSAAFCSLFAAFL